MLKLFLKSAIRCIFNQKVYADIHLLGLLIGMLSLSFTMVDMMDGTNDDYFQEKKDHINRLTTSKNKKELYGVVPFQWDFNMVNEIPKVEDYNTFQNPAPSIGIEDNTQASDSLLLKMLDLIQQF